MNKKKSTNEDKNIEFIIKRIFIEGALKKIFLLYQTAVRQGEKEYYREQYIDRYEKFNRAYDLSDRLKDMYKTLKEKE